MFSLSLCFAWPAEDIPGERQSIYSLLSGAPAAGGHTSAVPHEPEDDQVNTLRFHSLGNPQLSRSVAFGGDFH